jgi:hypothetical protein
VRAKPDGLEIIAHHDDPGPPMRLSRVWRISRHQTHWGSCGNRLHRAKVRWLVEWIAPGDSYLPMNVQVRAFKRRKDAWAFVRGEIG